MVVGYVHDREASQANQRDAAMFLCDSADLDLVVDNGFPISQLHTAAASSTFAELAEHLRSVDDYHWVDVYVGHARTDR